VRLDWHDWTILDLGGLLTHDVSEELCFVLAAYKHADGKKIDGRRVLVDVERARTVKGWRPRRLGGGLGSTRKSREEERVEEAPAEREKRDRSRSPRERRRRSRSPKPVSRSQERRPRASRPERGAEREAGERRRSRSRERKKRRSRSPRERKRSRSRDRKRSRRSRSRERRRDRDPENVKIKTEKSDDGYPGGDAPPNGEVSNGESAAPELPEGESQQLTEYPAPEEIKNEDDNNRDRERD